FSLSVIVILALGTGALTAVSGVVRTVLWGGLPYPDADRVFRIEAFLPSVNASAVFSPALYEWRDRRTSLVGIAGYQDWLTGTATSPGDTELIPIAALTGEFVGVVGVNPTLGRHLMEADELEGAPHVAIISHALWTDRFGAQPGALGSVVAMDGAGYAVVGVLPQDFRFPGGATPRLLVPLQHRQSPRPVAAIARARAGVTPEAIRSELEAQIAQAAFPARTASMFAGMRLDVTSLQAHTTAAVRVPLLVLLASSVLVLVVACTNVVGLYMARAQVRRREMAVRAALGASSLRLIRQLTMESMLLSICGGLL